MTVDPDGLWQAPQAPIDINLQLWLLQSPGLVSFSNWPAGGLIRYGLTPPTGTKSPCSSLTLDERTVFFNPTFVAPVQVGQYIKSYAGPKGAAAWDGAAVGLAFAAAGVNPGVGVGIMSAETSLANAKGGPSVRNLNDPFSSQLGTSAGDATFLRSLRRGLATVLKLENATKTPATPLSALINQQNDLRGKGTPGQQYDLTDPSTWAANVNAGFVAMAKAAGACQQ